MLMTARGLGSVLGRRYPVETIAFGVELADPLPGCDRYDEGANPAEACKDVTRAGDEPHETINGMISGDTGRHREEQGDHGAQHRGSGASEEVPAGRQDDDAYQKSDHDGRQIVMVTAVEPQSDGKAGT